MGRKRKHADVSITSSSDSSSLVDSEVLQPLNQFTGRCSPNVVADSSSNRQQQTTSGLNADVDAFANSPPVQRNAANERERARMRVLSRAFTRLKTSLPWVPADTKLSKLDTLRLASCYIAHLSRTLQADEEAAAASTKMMTSSNTPGSETSGCGASTMTSLSGEFGGDFVIKEEKQTTTAVGGCTAGRTACGGSNAGNIHPLNLTWPFTFSSRNGTTVAHLHRSGAPLSAAGDVRGGNSSSLVTSSNIGGGRIKIRTGRGMQSSMLTAAASGSG